MSVQNLMQPFENFPRPKKVNAICINQKFSTMITKLRTFLAAGMVIASLPLLSTANNGKGQGKTTLCHNGHEITIANPAVSHHLKNHQKNFECFIVTADRPCGSKKTKPPCGGCS